VYQEEEEEKELEEEEEEEEEDWYSLDQVPTTSHQVKMDKKLSKRLSKN
jgi:hypothetical protein